MRKSSETRDLDHQLEPYTQAAANCSPDRRPALRGSLPSAAVTAALAMTAQADANIIYSGSTNITIFTSAFGAFQSQTTKLDIDGNGVDDFQFSAKASHWLTFFPVTSSAGWVAAEAQGLAPGNVLFSTVANMAKNFAPSALVGTGLTNASVFFRYENMFTLPGQGNWNDSISGLAGFQFMRGSTNHFGWLRLHVSVDAPMGGPSRSSLSITEFAWEQNPDTPIPAGAVPEPGALALLAMGAAGIWATRKRSQHPSS